MWKVLVRLPFNDSSFNEEDIHITREDPEVSFDEKSKMDDGEVDVLGNTDNIQDAFIFCLNMGTIKMNKILEQGIFISEREMGQMEETQTLSSINSLQ